MTTMQVCLLLWIMAPHPSVYVKGHSQAANKVRQSIETFTCYSSAPESESSGTTLQVDHLLSRSGRSWIVMVLTNSNRKVLYEGKAEENPWPLPSPLEKLLKQMTKSTCPGYQDSKFRKSAQPTANREANHETLR